jgi:hypothetical protein
MSDTFCDATQSFENETSVSSTITTISNVDLLTPPPNGDPSYLIKLVNNGSTNNLYILQANQNGEIRFLTKDAYLNNDVSANDGNQYYNVKIGADGKLYCYWTYNFITNPLKVSGWYDIMSEVIGQGAQLTLLEAGFTGFELQLITAQTNITTLFSNVGVLNTEIIQINAEIGALATQTNIFQGLFGEIQRTFYASRSKALVGRFTRTNWKDAVTTLRTRFDLRQTAGRLGNVMSPARTLTAPQLSAYQMVSSQAGFAISKAVSDVGLTLGIISGGAVLAGIYKYYSNAEEDTKRDLISDLIETKEDMLLQQANTPNSYYTTMNRIAEVGLSINAGTQGNYTGAIGFYEVSLATSPNNSTGGYIVIEIYLVATVKTARISKVLDSGTRAWAIGNTISIDKQTDLGGWDNAGTRYLLLNVNIVYSPLQAIDLIINSVLAEQPIDDRRNRRRAGVIGTGEYDTSIFTTASATETNTDTGEIITYSTLKSRLNLLPTGTSDIDIYTSTGQVGIGTAPTAKLHTYHATNNILRLETSTTGTNSIEFRRGTANDVFTDYRLISDAGVFKLQYENNLLAYGASGTELFNSTATLTSIFKNTSFSGNVGINVAPHATYKLDVAGDINISTGSLLRLNGVAYKPAEAVLADTATALASGTILGISQGGTGASSHTAGNVILGNGSGALTSATGLNWNSGTTSLTAPNVNLPTGGKYKINATDLALTDLTGTLQVNKGGTGQTTFTANGLLIGNTTSAITQNAGLTFITSTLTAPNMNVPTGGKYKINNVDLALVDLDGTLAVGKGGTGQTTFTANGLLIGNTTSGITQNAGLTFITSTLTTPNMNVPTGGKYKINNVDLSYNDLTDKLTAGTNIAISAGNVISATGGGTAYTAGDGIAISVANAISFSGITTNSFVISRLLASGSIDMFILQNNPTNSLRIRQNFLGTNDFTYNVIQKNNNVDYPAFTFKNGQVAIGTTNVPTYALDVAGDINLTGDLRRLSALYKPAGAVLADTATDLATGAILSVGKGGTGANTFTAGRLLVGNTASALQTYAGLTWTTANNLLTTTNLLVGTNASITGNVGIGTIAPAGGIKLDVLGDVNITGKTTQKGTLECLTLNPATPTIPTALSIIPAPTFTFTPSSTTTRCAILTYQGTGTGTAYSVVIPAGGMYCDILMVGGGGSGGRDIGGGGGGGAVLYAENVLLKQDTYMVSVGRGALSTSGETKGQSTTGFGATLLGGGSAGDATWNSATYANDGGSGAGGKGVPDAWSNRGGRPIVGGSVKGGILCDGTLYEGKVGGYAIAQNTNQVVSAGGGGANVVGGGGGTSGGTGGSAVGASGGAGISNNILDTTYFWGGGGGGGSYQYTTPANGGAGGGGAGQNNNGGGITATGNNGASSFFAVGTTINGINGTGGGGGGSGYTTSSAGSGGAGVIIIRYRRPINHNETIDILPTGTNATTNFKQGVIGANYKIEASLSSIIVDAFTIDPITASTSIKNSGLVVKSSTNDTLITNNCGIGIDPSSTYKLNVNGDLNVNGTIWQNGFSVNAGFQQYRTFNFTYTGDTNFLLTTRARYCNIICFCSTNAGWIASNGANMAIGEFRGTLGFSGGISNGVNNYFFYWTMQGDNPRPFKAWFGNGNNTTFTFIEMWYN